MEQNNEANTAAPSSNYCFETNNDSSTAINFPITYSSNPPKANTMAGNITRKLYVLANEGEIMVPIEELEKAVISGYGKKGTTISNQFYLALQEAEDKAMIVMTTRQFGNKIPNKYASIRLKNVSLESVNWILKSLEKDEMTPIERAIQSRFKESFGIKMNSPQWNKLLDELKHPYTLTKKPEDSIYEFDQIEIDDSVSGCRTVAIYPKGKRWPAIDMSLKPSDINQELFKEFLKFLENYFMPSAEEEKPSNSQEEKCIPGGRYGCAQFVKACGNGKLTSCSLGQLAQFIQYAINEDILRYQRTLLVWNREPMKQKKHEISSSDSEAVRKQKEKIVQKLTLAKQAIIEVLTENPAGLSLAQLPLHLKYKLPFQLDLNELGFVKLKELLCTMDKQIKIELRGNNHPFAKLISTSTFGKLKSVDFDTSNKSSLNQKKANDATYLNSRPTAYVADQRQQSYMQYIDFNKQLETIRNCIYTLLREFKPGIDSTKIRLLLYTRLGINFDWYIFGCSTLYQFLQKYVSPYYELEFIPINTYDTDHFVLRLKDVYRAYPSNSPFYPQYSTPYYPVHYRFETDPNALSNFPSGSSHTEGRSVDLTSNFNSLSISAVPQDKSIGSIMSTPAQSISEAFSSNTNTNNLFKNSSSTFTFTSSTYSWNVKSFIR